MKYCIYLKKTEPLVSFSSGEHIFPAGIGGIQKLPVEYVSHECNNAFSKMELEFMRDSIISIPRQFSGPGKRGNLSIKKSTKSKVSILNSLEHPDKLEFGYISLGKAFIIPQIKIDTFGACSFTADVSFGDSKTVIKNFINTIEKSKKKYIFFEGDNFKNNEFLLGIYNGKLYLGLNSKENINYFEKTMQEIISKKLLYNVDPIYKSSRLEVNQTLKMDLNIYFRVCAKIIFNYLSYIKGQEFVIRDCFDPLRNWIVNSGENEFVKLVQEKEIFKILDFPKDSHKIVIFKKGNSLMGYVSFYGETFQNKIVLCENFNESFEIKMFICDWKQRKEFSLPQFLEQINKK
ncbi:hypothetical protein [Exiguobacterium artemiae]|uniref:hypothetical protein n=1 Tax=Exiguobacterium artemiae TaxID=340145 RepID=UPI002963F59A|nr:hypothetical protein [Exiguobacterium sibiricum]MDW2885211.1 hypothetical protein [Exiguobacterium sibiricum]